MSQLVKWNSNKQKTQSATNFAWFAMRLMLLLAMITGFMASYAQTLQTIGSNGIQDALVSKGEITVDNSGIIQNEFEYYSSRKFSWHENVPKKNIVLLDMSVLGSWKADLQSLQSHALGMFLTEAVM